MSVPVLQEVLRTTVAVATAGNVDGVHINRSAKIDRNPRIELAPVLGMCTAWLDKMRCDHATIV